MASAHSNNNNGNNDKKKNNNRKLERVERLFEIITEEEVLESLITIAVLEERRAAAAAIGPLSPVKKRSRHRHRPKVQRLICNGHMITLPNDQGLDERLAAILEVFYATDPSQLTPYDMTSINDPVPCCSTSVANPVKYATNKTVNFNNPFSQFPADESGPAAPVALKKAKPILKKIPRRPFFEKRVIPGLKRYDPDPYSNTPPKLYPPGLPPGVDQNALDLAILDDVARRHGLSSIPVDPVDSPVQQRKPKLMAEPKQKQKALKLPKITEDPSPSTSSKSSSKSQAKPSSQVITVIIPKDKVKPRSKSPIKQLPPPAQSSDPSSEPSSKPVSRAASKISTMASKMKKMSDLRILHILKGRTHFDGDVERPPKNEFLTLADISDPNHPEKVEPVLESEVEPEVGSRTNDEKWWELCDFRGFEDTQITFKADEQKNKLNIVGYRMKRENMNSRHIVEIIQHVMPNMLRVARISNGYVVIENFRIILLGIYFTKLAN